MNMKMMKIWRRFQEVIEEGQRNNYQTSTKEMRMDTDMREEVKEGQLEKGDQVAETNKQD